MARLARLTCLPEITLRITARDAVHYREGCSRNMPPCRRSQGGIEGSDAGGRNDSVAMVGNQTVVESRLQAARRSKASRVGGAVQARLGKTVDKATLEADREAAMQRGSLVQVSIEHVAAAERKLDQYLLLFPLPNGAAYPSAEMMVEFGSWCSRVRERRCLAHRVDSERGGLGKGTVRKYLSEMFNHIWSCKISTPHVVNVFDR